MNIQKSEPPIVVVHFAHMDTIPMDTILLHSQEQNRPSQMTLSTPGKFMQKIAFLSLVLGFVGLAGCGSKAPETPTETSAASRPALIIWIVDAPELEKEISQRWQAASDQSLKIENFPSTEFANRSPFNADVVIYPGTILGDLIKNDAVARLPAEAIAKRESDRPDDSGTSAWPTRWKNIATFGGQLYAVPLGATNLAVAMSALDSGPLNQLNMFLTDLRELNSQSMEHWAQVLNQAETLLANTIEDRRKTLEECLSRISEVEQALLVDRFLFIASTTNARSRGLFDLVKMRARLNQPEFSNSAKILARIARLFPETIAIDPSKAWDFIASRSNGSVAFAIGWPSSMVGSSSESDSESSGQIKIAPIAWNPGRGLIASIGRKTRQTSVACNFLVWLSDPAQRKSLRSVCPRVELTMDQSDRNGARDDYRAFQAINNRDSRVEPMELSLRMANSDQYRAILAQSLVASIREPDQIDSILASCASKWDQLTEKLGIDLQRISEEKSLGHRK